MTITLCLISFLAGLVDSVVGGGGLIQIPALFILLPGVSPATIFGTNKFAMIFGTAVALVRYSRRIQFPWATALPTAGVAAVGALLGAKTVNLINPDLLRPVIFLLLIGVAFYTYRTKNFGAAPARQHSTKRTTLQTVLIGAAIGLTLGFYDGFFGPGTGSFLIFAFVSLFGFEFLVASAAAKLVNVCTNFTPILYFGLHDQILYELALPMAACNILGSLLGTHLAFARGNLFIRRLFLVVVLLVILRFGWDIFGAFL